MNDLKKTTKLIPWNFDHGIDPVVLAIPGSPVIIESLATADDGDEDGEQIVCAVETKYFTPNIAVVSLVVIPVSLCGHIDCTTEPSRICMN